MRSNQNPATYIAGKNACCRRSTVRSTFQAALAVALTFGGGAGVCRFRLAGQRHLLASATKVEAYDFVEVSLNVASPDARNPFTDVTVQAQFGY